MSPNPMDIDRFSDLPEALQVSILSLLPTRMAARTSLLSRHFRHLWEASPSLDLTGPVDPFDPYPGEGRGQHDMFCNMADRTLLRRNPSLSLFSFSLKITCGDRYSHSFIHSLLVKACSFSLRQLTIETPRFSHIAAALPAIFSIPSLESLSVPALSLVHGTYKRYHPSPSAASLSRLTSLSIGSYAMCATQFNQLLSELPSLQDLELGVCRGSRFCISSHTVRNLKVRVEPCQPTFGFLWLSFPLLESVHFEYWLTFLELRLTHRNVPRQGKATIDLNCINDGKFRCAGDMLSYVSRAKDIILRASQTYWYLKVHERKWEAMRRHDRTERYHLMHTLRTLA